MPDIPRSDNGSVSGADYSNPKDPFGARLTGPFGHAVSIGLTPCSDSLRFATRPTLPGHSLYNAQLPLSYQGLRELSRLAVQAIGKASANLSLELGRVDWAMNADFSSAPHRAPGHRSLLSPANPQASVALLFLHLPIIRARPPLLRVKRQRLATPQALDHPSPSFHPTLYPALSAEHALGAITGTWRRLGWETSAKSYSWKKKEPSEAYQVKEA